MTDPGISDRPNVEGSYAAGEGDLGTDNNTGDVQQAPIREWIEAVQGVVTHNAETRPYTTLFVAGALGYVLAAGIPSVVSKAALNIGGRMVMARIVQSLLNEQI